MTKTRPKRRILRTIFTAFTLLLVAGYVATGFCFVSVWWGYKLYILGQGTFVHFPFGLRHEVERTNSDGNISCGCSGDIRPLSFFGAFNSRNLPLWPFVSLLMIATSYWYWRDQHIGSGPGYCRICGYNLRGNVSGQCPECGTTAQPKHV